MVGTTISHYHVTEKLGEGGMGEVYKARDTRLDRPVALKVLSARTSGLAEQSMRLLREAKSASALNHPNIITVYDVGTVPGTDPPSPFIAMEYVNGPTLREIIARRPCTVSETLRYAVQIADALAAAHAAGIVHRDIKPANIMVNDKGLVKVVDFGLAHIGGKDEAGDDVTQSATLTLRTLPGQVLGTPAYLSPEQLDGRPADSRSDIFSFGVLLYEMLAGRRPFDGKTTGDIAVAILTREPEPLSRHAPKAPAELERIVTACLRKDPERRYQHMADVRIALEALREEITSASATARVAGERRVRRRWLFTAAAAVMACAAWLVFRAGERREPVRVTVLTTFAGIEAYPAFSPDGNRIAFSWNGEGQDNFDIYVRATAGGAHRRLSTAPGKDEKPAWSPDGSRIAWVRDNQTILTAPADGGPERVVAEGEFSGDLRWTPDGQAVAFAELPAGESLYSVFTADISTGQRRRWTHPPAGTLGDRPFGFSPDGKWIALGRYSMTPGTDILIAPADKPVQPGTERKVGRDVVWIAGLGWSPDSKSILFTSQRGAQHKIMRLPVPLFGEGRIEMIEGVELEAAHHSVTGANGSRPAQLAFERRSADHNIWRYDLGAKADPKTARAERVVDSTARDSSPHLTADGSRIVFSSNRSGETEIWTADATGANPAQLTRIRLSSGSPHWSPDGRWIVFDAASGGNKDLWIADATGAAEPRRLTTEPSEEARPVFSHDGAWIYFRSDRSGSRQIWKIPAAGGAAIQVTRNGGVEPMSDWQGRDLFYIRRNRDPEVWKVPVNGGEETLAVKGPQYGYWAVAEKGIYFLADAQLPGVRRRAIRRWDFGTKKMTNEAWIEKGIDLSLPGFSVSRDGRRVVALQLDKIEADLYLVENFR